MISGTAQRLAIGFLVTVIACRGEPTARDRLLARIGGDAVVAVVADSRAISHPRIRAALDVVASHWPAGMGCVLDAAFAGDQAAVTADAAGNITVLIASPVEPRCAALSQRTPGLWIATIGAGPAAVSRSLLDDERFARARPYLRTAPLAAVALGDVHLLATAQPEPLEAWLAIEARSDAPASADAAAQAISDQLTRLRGDPATAALAAKLRLTRTAEAQVVVQLDAAADADLAALVRGLLAWVDPQARPAATRFTCPAPSPDITCSGEMRYGVRSLRAVVARVVTDGNAAPIVANGTVTGLRLAAAVAPLGLAAGDVVLAVDGRLVQSRAMFLHLVEQARARIAVTVRRGASEAQLHFAER